MTKIPHFSLHSTVKAYVADTVIASDYDHYFQNNPLFDYDGRFILKHVHAGMSILDLGCGTGRHLSTLADNNIRAIGMDLSAAMLAEAKNKLTEKSIAVPPALVQGNLLHLPIRCIAVDAILLMFSTLGLLHEQAMRLHALQEIRRVLRPGGTFIFHVHNRHYRPGALRFILGKESMSGDRIIKNYRGIMDLYIHVFSHDEICDLLCDAGFLLTEFLPLNDRRDGPCTSNNIDRDANGFLIAAQKPDIANEIGKNKD